MPKFTPNYAVPVSDLVTNLLDPVLRKRAGISIGLIQSWEEIVGPRLAATSRPEKIQWPKRAQHEYAFEPAVLIIACEGAAALHIQHETTEIIGRVNAFLGFSAIGRIRIVQKPVQAASPAQKRTLAPLTSDEISQLGNTVAAIEDGDLRASLERLGRSVIGQKRAKR
jgi:hypothetical protein